MLVPIGLSESDRQSSCNAHGPECHETQLWNFQAGYRAIRLFRYQRGDDEIGFRGRGFDFILGVEF